MPVFPVKGGNIKQEGNGPGWLGQKERDLLAKPD